MSDREHRPRPGPHPRDTPRRQRQQAERDQAADQVVARPAPGRPAGRSCRRRCAASRLPWPRRTRGAPAVVCRMPGGGVVAVVLGAARRSHGHVVTLGSRAPRRHAADRTPAGVVRPRRRRMLPTVRIDGRPPLAVTPTGTSREVLRRQQPCTAENIWEMKLPEMVVLIACVVMASNTSAAGVVHQPGEDDHRLGRDLGADSGLSPADCGC